MKRFAFAGRKREKSRVWKLLKKNFGGYAPEIKEFLDAQYDENVPYHGPVHVLYGLAYLVGIGHTERIKRDELADIICYWLGHDAGHNGVAAESPEEKSAGIFFDSKLFTREFPKFAAIARSSILGTKFPYPLKSNLSAANEFFQLRMLDTLRVAGGATAPFLGLDQTPDPFLVCMYESCGLWLELKLDPETWLRKGQLGFFFPHLRDCLMDGNVFGLYSDDVTFSLQTWKNHQRLYEIMLDDGKKKNFLALINWAMTHDCTLPEFLATAKDLCL